MSRTEHHHGTLRDTGLTVSAFILTLPQDKQPDSDDLSWRSVEEWFNEEYYKKALVIDDTVWVADNKAIEDLDSGIFDAEMQEDGSYTYTLQYYNGGCCWEEALLSALGKS